jgi:hypothetical protein
MASRWFFALLPACLAGGLFAQESLPLNENAAVAIPFGLGFHLPAGDLAERFGMVSSVGGGVVFLPRQRPWFLGFDGQFLFGSEVKTDVLAALRTPEGFIYGDDRNVAEVLLRMRGFTAAIVGGYLAPLSPGNPRSALRLALGLGIFQHRIRIQDDPERRVPQIEGAYRQGYDRLSDGPALSLSLGYQLLSRDGRVNFLAALECQAAGTRSRRDFDFASRRRDEQSRLDLLPGLRLAWILPVYLRKAEEIYY